MGPVALALALLLQPGAPQRVCLTWSGDPATTATVTWRTDGDLGDQKAEFALASADPRFRGSAQTVGALNTRVELDTKASAWYHRATLTNLKPETIYAYRVGDGKAWSEWFQFKTASPEFKPFEFVYFGDAQNEIKSMWSRVVRQAHRDAPYAAFMLHAGDLVNTNDSDKEWGEWFEAGGWLHSQIPVVATPGNHEYGKAADGKRLTPLWTPQFAFPANGPAGLEGSCYYVDFQGCRVVSLNSNEKVEEQAVWLDRVLAENPNRWTFVTFHHPVYSTAVGRDNPKVRGQWQPIFQEHKVDLVLQGHDHTYGRRNVPTGANVRDGAGVVYVVSVAGPKMYRLGETALNDMKRVAEYTQLYQVVKVEYDKLRFESRTATGELYDAFELRRRPNGGNDLEEIKPEVPQRIDPKGASDEKDGG
ncbi:MAG: metallophosphoesterase family protein [Fimbriimonadaceae bacterium]|nr:metallophosphoesterase family protein [Fimbriimonadaceae bacterium]QYK56230.1 MAG: metallophosphoesterase family protein [Fimbriimonadaceae bacterium]